MDNRHNACISSLCPCVLLEMKSNEPAEARTAQTTKQVHSVTRSRVPSESCLLFLVNEDLDHVIVIQSPSHVQLFETPWTAAHQALLFMGFFRQEYWSGLSFPSSGDLPNPRIRSASPALQEDSLPLNHQGSPSNMFSPAKTETIFTVPQSSEEGDPDITQGAAARVGAGACLPEGHHEGRTGSGD